MNNAKLLTLCLCAVLLAPAFSQGEEFLLYAPKPATGDKVPSSPDEGILVKSITVKRGDTLSDLSRKHIGVGSWFPQVLLFNKIKNPDLIYVGDKLLVPVPRESATSVKKASKGKKHHVSRRSSHRRKHAVSKQLAEPVKTRIALPSSDEQDNYRTAKQAYLAGDYQRALDLFGGFLHKFPNSALVPDASLYQADCLLHLSAQ